MAHDPPRVDSVDSEATHAADQSQYEEHNANPPPLDEGDTYNLPYRTLSANANMAEYTTETATGAIATTVMSRVSGKLEDYELVTFVTGDKENPKNWSKSYKWYCTMIVAFTCFVVAFASAVITADLVGVMEEFNVSEEISLLTITVYVIGFGVGKFDRSFLWPGTTKLTRLQAQWHSLPCPKFSAAESFTAARF